MTYRELIFFFPYKDLIPIILSFLAKPHRQAAIERMHIEMRHNNVLSDIHYTSFIYKLNRQQFNRSTGKYKGYIKMLNADIKSLKQNYSLLRPFSKKDYKRRRPAIN
jgi:hypothetical protein